MDPKDKTVQKRSSTYFQLAAPIPLRFIRPGRPLGSTESLGSTHYRPGQSKSLKTESTKVRLRYVPSSLKALSSRQMLAGELPGAQARAAVNAEEKVEPRPGPLPASPKSQASWRCPGVLLCEEYGGGRGCVFRSHEKHSTHPRKISPSL